MRALAAFQAVLVAAALAAGGVAHGQSVTSGDAVAIVFAGELGEGRFDDALMRGIGGELALTQRLVLVEEPYLADTARRRVEETVPERWPRDLEGLAPPGVAWLAVVRVRSLAEHATAAGRSYFEAVLTLSLTQTSTGRSWLWRSVRASYPLVAPSTLEALGELGGRKVARLVCDAACPFVARPPGPPPVPRPRSIIKESDW